MRTLELMATTDRPFRRPTPSPSSSPLHPPPPALHPPPPALHPPALQPHPLHPGSPLQPSLTFHAPPPFPPPSPPPPFHLLPVLHLIALQPHSLHPSPPLQPLSLFHASSFYTVSSRRIFFLLFPLTCYHLLSILFLIFILL